MLFARLSPVEMVALLTTLVVGLSVHEFAHAWSAYRLGDPTAYWAGRLTLDPRKHFDPFGALMLLVVGFGWAKPVPIDPSRLGRRGTLIVSAAGPLSNVLLATAAAVVVRLGAGAFAPAAMLLAYFAYFNLMLAAFNSLPIAPLDGWRVVMGLVPPSTALRLQEVEQYSSLILVGLIVVGNVGGFNVLGTLIQGPVGWLGRIMLGPQFG
jgi:Zn-dependent protease